jgi:hypothetical protein
MKAIDAIRIALKFSDMGMKHLGEMSDAPLLRPGPWGGNHAMWVAGHLTVVEGRLQKMLRGTPNPVERWKPLFDWGSEPVDNPRIIRRSTKCCGSLKNCGNRRTHFSMKSARSVWISRRSVNRRVSADSRRWAPRSSLSLATRAAAWAG